MISENYVEATLSERIVALINSKLSSPTKDEIDALVEDYTFNRTKHKRRLRDFLTVAHTLAEPFQAENPTIEYDGWIDVCTDNILLKVYSRPRTEGQPDVEYALAAVLRRNFIIDNQDNISEEIKTLWRALTISIKEGILNGSDAARKAGEPTKILTLHEANSWNDDEAFQQYARAKTTKTESGPAV